MTTTTVDTPDAEALRVAIDRQMLEYDGAMPCVVHAVSADGTTVDVIPAISKSVTLEGVRQPIGDRVIRGVPIAMYGDTTLGLFVCPPIRQGSDGIVWAMDRAMDNWQHGDGIRMPPAMQTPRQRDFSDAMFYPGAQRASSAIDNYPTEALTIQNRAGSTVASVKDGEIKIMVGPVTITVTAGGIVIAGDVTIAGAFDLTGVMTHTGDLGQMGNQVVNGTITANEFIDV